MLPKHLLYVSNDELLACHWQRGQLGPARRFGADPAGIEAFGAYLDEHVEMRAYVVADMVEEDFQRCLLPHVGGRAGRAMIERRLANLYRDTPYRHADIQERAAPDAQGRRDDQALFSALTNAALLRPWLAVLEERRLPLAAVYSAAYLSGLLVRKLAVAQHHLLLITEQPGGLRQSYFQGRHLRFSRLTALGAGEDVVAATVAETARMQQFLTSTRLVERGELLHVLVLAPAARVALLEHSCKNDPELAFHFMDMDTASARLKLASPPGPPATAERLLLGLLGRAAPPSQYRTGSAGRYYTIWRTRLFLNAASAGIAVGGAVWLLASVWGSIADASERERLLAETAQFETNYARLMSELPPIAARSANMKAAVLLDERVRARSPHPAQLTALVSQALDRAPAIRLLALDWQVEQPATAPAGAASSGLPFHPAGADHTGEEGAAPLSGATLGLPTAPAQILRIDGEIDLPAADYRNMLGSVNQFAQDLARQSGLAVEIVAAPLDVRQNVRLSGKTDQADAATRPAFAIKVTWRP